MSSDQAVREPSPLAWRPILVAMAVIAAVVGATITRYGFHRDELYFLTAGQHLAWGYDDQPPLTPLIIRGVTELFGPSLVAVRIVPLLLALALVPLTAACARELGAGRRGQAVAAIGLAVTGLVPLAGHLLTTATTDVFFFTLISWLVARWLRTGNDRLLPVAGLVAGIGLLNNNLIGALIGALLIGALLVGPRRRLWNRWMGLAALIAVALWLPYLIWQARHGWPQIDMGRAISSTDNRIMLVPFQFATTLFTAPVWVTGLVVLFRSERLRPYRLFGVAFGVLLVMVLVTGGKPYYLSGMVAILYAAGGQPVIDWVGRGRAALRRSVSVAGFAVTGVFGVLISLPVLPVEAFAASPIPALNELTGETVAWPLLVDRVAEAYRSLPADERADAVILTSNYGEAGAIDQFGGDRGLPRAYSGHNAYWRWGPPDGGDTVVTVGLDPRRLAEYWSDVTVVDHIDNGLDLDNEEQGEVVAICRDPNLNWSELWPDVRHLD